jgi:hypothetical protein
VLADFGPIKGVLPGFVESLEKWNGPNRANVNQARAALAGFTEARDELASLPSYADAPRALADYRLASALYVAAGRLAVAGADQAKGALQDQTRLTVKRLRALGDRIFDQAAVELKALIGPNVVPDLGVTRPAEVPAWAALGLAAGPPLATAAPAPAPARAYQADRPTQSFADWAKVVQGAKVPTAAAEATTLAGGRPAQLGRLAQEFTRAANALYATPDPSGERALATRVSLGLLIRAEAARVDQLSALAGSVELRVVATTLSSLADQLWDARLGDRVASHR